MTHGGQTHEAKHHVGSLAKKLYKLYFGKGKEGPAMLS